MNAKRIKFISFYLFFLQGVKTNLLQSIENLKIEFDDATKEKFSVFQEKNIQNKYLEIYKTGAIKTEPVNPLEIAKNFSIELANEFRKKMESLKRAVDFAEEEARNYKWNPDITSKDVNYTDSKKLLDNNTELVDHPLFKTRVIPDKSSVHIPTEIYEEDDNILNTIKWTKPLDEVFLNNSRDLRYQYFASVFGVIVQFPGMKWRKNGTDMFDVRRRPWYVQGASSPKDVMILIDTSGSMHGISIKLTKLAVQKLIDTMGENDYIAVAQFPGLKENKSVEPHLLSDHPEKKNFCFETFVQASKRNKDRLFQQITRLRARGIAHLDEALEFAINEFHKFDNRSQRENEGANCNRLIIVFTDSGDEYDREKIRSLMNQSNSTKNLRIFIYYVGEEVIPIDVLENRTCDNRGYFGHIHAMGAVSNIIDKYSVSVHKHGIHRGCKLEESEFRLGLIFVNDDEFHNPEDFPHPGMGLMTSLTMPVYNRSGNGSFLGLLGTDMTVAFMDDLVPHNKLGPTGYAFAINTNGYIIFHPELKNQLGWMRDPPNVDLVEIEYNSEDKIKIRSSIINCAASNGTMKGMDDVRSLIKVPDEIHTYEKVRTYAYYGVPYSTFGITIVTSKYIQFYPTFSVDIKFLKLTECSSSLCSMVISIPNLKNIDLKFTNDVFLYAEIGLIKRCKLADSGQAHLNATTTTPSYEATSNVQKTESHLVPITTMGSTISSSITILQNINISKEVTMPYENNQSVTTEYQIPKFSEELLRTLVCLQNQSKDKCPEIESKRIIVDLYALESIAKYVTLSESVRSLIFTTVTGLTMVYPKSERHVYKDLFDNSSNSAIFQRTFDMDKIIFYTYFNRQSLPNESEKQNSINPDIMMFKAFSATLTEKETIPIAVMGLSWNQSFIISLLQKHEACNETRVCYLLEDGGYVISVNDLKLSYQVGYFFGDVQPLIMETLLNNSIYKSIEDFDYQAICPKEKEEEMSSASVRLKPIIYLLNIPVLIFKQILLYMENLFLFIKLIIHLTYLHMSSAQEATATDNKNVSCIKKYYRYYLNDEVSFEKPKEIVQICDNSTFSLIAHKTVSSNLLILSFDKICAVNCSSIPREPVPRYPIKDNGPDICKISKEPKYRLRPNYKCYAFNPDEDFMKCNSQRLEFITTTYLLTFILTTKSLLLIIINNLHL